MDDGQRATLGLALIAAAYSGFIYFVLQAPFGLFTVCPPGIAFGLWLATAGLAAMRRTERGYGLFATGLAIAAAFSIVLLIADLGAADLFKVPHAIAAVGFTQAAWYAMGWWFGPTGSARKAVAGLGVSAWVLVVAGVLYLVLVLLRGFLEGVPLEVLYAIGAWLLARHIGPAQAALEARLHRGPGGDTAGLRAPLPREAPRQRIG